MTDRRAVPPALQRIAASVLAACAAGLMAGCAFAPAQPQAADWPARHGLVDPRARIAVISAFPDELELLKSRVVDARAVRLQGVDFTLGALQGQPVVLFLSGVSMTNAAMNTQRALDRFRVSHIVFSGIAGGVDPALNIGDVSVPERWGQYLEVRMMRELAPGRFDLPQHAPGAPADAELPSFGMMQTRPVVVVSDTQPQRHARFWFDADPAMLAVARQLGAGALTACDDGGQCLPQRPRLVVGGHGVSGPAFVDNAAFRAYTARGFQARVLDMETAATAHVAYANGVPFIAFRSVSDLAGGGREANEIRIFGRLAANNSARVLMDFLATWKPAASSSP